MAVDYVLTAFSPAMFGPESTIRLTTIKHATAKDMIDNSTMLHATKLPHEKMARSFFPDLSQNLARYVSMNKPGQSAIALRYQGPPLGPGGDVPDGGSVTCYLLEIQ